MHGETVKFTNKTVYLIVVSIPNSGNLPTAYTEKTRKYVN
jgi:hypothetical protein